MRIRDSLNALIEGRLSSADGRLGDIILYVPSLIRYK